jgi:hypothetical protein
MGRKQDFFAAPVQGPTLRAVLVTSQFGFGETRLV